MLTLYSNNYDIESKLPYLQQTSYSYENEILDFTNDAIYVFSTQRFNRYIQRKYIEKHSQGGLTVPDIKVYNLLQLALSIVKSHKPDTQMIDEQLRYFRFVRIIREQKNKLSFFTDKNRSLHSIKNITETLSSLRDKGVKSCDIKIGESESGRTADRLHDIKFILYTYESQLEDQKESLEDEFSVFKKACEILNSDPLKSEEFIDKDIVLSGFVRFRDYEIEFIRCLGLHSRYGVRIDFKASEDNQRLFKSIYEISSSLKQDKIYSELYIDNSSPITSAITNNLFNYKVSDSSYVSSCFNNIKCTSKSEEVEVIARLIKYFHTQENVPINKMIVLGADSSEYSHLVREIFSLEGIPANITDRFILSRSPVVTSLISLVEAIEDGMPRSSLLSLAKNRYLYIFEKNLSITDISEAIYAYKIFSVKKWKEKKSKSESNQISSVDKQPIDSSFSLINHAYKEKFEKVVNSIDDFYSEYASFKVSNRLTVDQFINYFIAVIRNTKIYENITSLKSKLSDDRHLHEHTIIRHELEKDSQAFNALIELLIKFPEFYEEDKSKYDFFELLNHFKVILSLTRYQIKELPDYGINITSIEQARELDYDIAFVLGMSDSQMPKNSKSGEPSLENLFKSSREKEYEYNKLLFHQLLTNRKSYNTDDKFFFTYSSQIEGKTTSESHFTTHLKRMLGYSDKNKVESFQEYDIVELKPKNLFEHTLVGDIRHSIISKGKTFEENNYSGAYISSELLKAFVDRKYSISQLENYNTCSLAYLFNYILRISNKYNVNDQSIFVEKNEVGQYFHTSLEQFFIRALKLQNDNHVHLESTNNTRLILDPNKIDIYRELMDQILDELYDSQYNLMFSDYEKNIKKPVLYAVIEEMIKQQEQDFNTIAVEKPFNFELPYIHPESNTELSISFHGTIDRIDIDSNGNLQILDYKTGKVVEAKYIIKPKSNSKDDKLQLGLYSYAADIEYEAQGYQTCKIGYIRLNSEIIQKDTQQSEPVYNSISDSNRVDIISLQERKLEQAKEILNSIFSNQFDRDEYKACTYCKHPELCKKVSEKFN